MAKFWDLPLKVFEGESKTLSTSNQYIARKPGFREMLLYNAGAFRLAFYPALKACVYYDSSTNIYTNYLTNVTDKSSSTHLPLDAMAETDILYMGFSNRVLGFNVDIGSNANAVTATLDVEYCSTAQAKSGNLVVTAAAFTNVADDSDSSDSGGATLAQDGDYTFTLPSDSAWKKSAIDKVSQDELYFIRFSPSAELSDPVDINEIHGIYQNTSLGYCQAAMEYPLALDDTVGGIQVLAANTPTLYCTHVK